jgi:hypothetical protein
MIAPVGSTTGRGFYYIPGAGEKSIRARLPGAAHHSTEGIKQQKNLEISPPSRNPRFFASLRMTKGRTVCGAVIVCHSEERSDEESLFTTERTRKEKEKKEYEATESTEDTEKEKRISPHLPMFPVVRNILLFL